MSVEMGIKDKRTGKYRTLPVATLQAFRDHWLPASEGLGLRFVSRLHDGSLNTVAAGDIPLVVDELKRLRVFFAGKQDYAEVVGRIDGILNAFATTDPAECEYDFG